MNPLLRKELRLLLPAWLVALAAATTPIWVGPDYEGVAMTLFGAGVLCVGLAPFGQEMTYGTFSLLLVQPEDRRRLWNLKAWLSAMALLSAWGVLVLSLWWNCSRSSRPLIGSSRDFEMTCGMCGMWTLAAYAGGLWTTLLLRDMIGAFFVSFLAPMAVLMATLLPLSHWIQTDGQMATGVFSVLAVYSVVAFWLGRKLFLLAEDIPWSGASQALPAAWGAPVRMVLRMVSTGFTKKCGPRAAFARKELQLQEFALVLVVGLVLGHLAAIWARHFYPANSESAARVLLDVAWIFWLIVPLVAGSVAVAQERRLNTHEGQLCVPFSTRNQFVIKFAMAMVVGIGLGGVVPALLEIGAREYGFANQLNQSAVLEFLVGIATGTALISFYASTLTNGLLPAFATTICLALGVVAAWNRFSSFNFWHRSIFICMAWPVMTATLVWLAYRNYKSLWAGWRLWFGNLGCAGAAFASVALLSCGIYNRPWELLFALEPPHGAARIAGPGHATIVDSFAGPAILLPDGRLWIGHRDINSRTRISGAFADGSNWVSLAAIYQGAGGAAAIKSDGTLWNVSAAAAISQIGSDSDWRKIVGNWSLFFALKRDGTAWEWGYVEDRHPLRSAVPYVAEPARVGNDPDCADIFAWSSGSPLKVVKNNGTICTLEEIQEHGPGRAPPRSHSEFKPWDLDLAGTNWTSLEGGPEWGLALGIRSDGSLWAEGNIPAPLFGIAAQPGGQDTAVRVGEKSDWAQLSASGVHLVALESNGTVSVMDRNFRAWHPSKYSDWIGAAAEFQDTWALAGDGTLYCWRENLEERNFDGPFLDRPWLRVTRRPIVAFNILDSK
ncbi:MAG: hypothetical protein ABSF38_10190 [Verrucomicrobiota bacterium]|jgi:hypothetical protein